MKVILDPRNRILYASYYILGLQELFGKSSIRFSLHPFEKLDRKNEADSFEQYMAFVIENQSVKTKYIIDYRDTTEIRSMAYDWCDVYAKINISHEEDLSLKKKLISIPPGFGIRAYSSLELSYICIVNIIKCRFKPLRGLYYHLCDYWASYKYELPISCYEYKENPKKDYVFLASTLWPHKNCNETTNPLRLAFMRTCKKFPNIKFEGGFLIQGKASKEYEEFSYHSRIKKSDYIQKVKDSIFVFNTPAVHNCHGWKLGEYLAMGKVIISTPISNLLPSSLENFKNIFIVETPKEMENGVSTLLSDEKLRDFIHSNNIAYYNTYVKPSAVILNILNYNNIK